MRSLDPDGDFVRLWGGQTISEIGSRISREGLPLVAVLTLGASPTQVGLIAAAGSLAVLLVGLVAGVWVDRLPRRPILISADIGRALVFASVPVAAIGGALAGGVLAKLIGIPAALFVSATGMLVAAVWLVRSPVLRVPI